MRRTLQTLRDQPQPAAAATVVAAPPTALAPRSLSAVSTAVEPDVRRLLVHSIFYFIVCLRCPRGRLSGAPLRLPPLPPLSRR
jgi:hypothetical protein